MITDARNLNVNLKVSKGTTIGENERIAYNEKVKGEIAVWLYDIHDHLYRLTHGDGKKTDKIRYKEEEKTFAKN